MAASYVTYPGNGAQTDFTIPFGYFEQSDVVVTVNDVPVSVTYLNASAIRISPAPAAATVVRLQRVTLASSGAVDFVDGSNLLEVDLDTLARRSIYVGEEALDTATGAVRPNFGGNFDAKNKKIVNLAAGTDAADAANKGQMDTAIAANIATTLRATGETLSVLAAASARRDRLLAFDAISGQPAVSSFTATQLASVVAAIYSASAGPLDALSFVYGGVGAVTRSAQDKMRDFVSVKDFGAVGDGVADDTAAFTAALSAMVAAGGLVFVPQGTYLVSSTIHVGGSGIHLMGAGIGATTLKASTPADPIITLTSGSNRLSVSCMTLDSTVARTDGGYGIYSPGVVSNCLLESLQVMNQWNGYQLGATDTSLVRHCTAHGNYNSGFAIVSVNEVSGGGCQWSMQNIISELNDGNGIEVRATQFAGVVQMTLGGLFDVNMFANSGFGLVVLGAAGCPVYGVRVNGMFSGQNGADSIYLDTYGNQHNIANFYLELDGTSTTGRTFTTAATHAGHGIFLTASNKAMRIASGLIKAPSLGGVVNSCSERLLFNDVAIEDCGQSTPNAGFYHSTTTGRLTMTGCASGNSAGGASQTYGFLADNGGVGISLVGCDFVGNTTAAISAGVNVEQINVLACFPNTFGNQLIGGLVMGAATGGNKGSGTINVAGSVDLNGAVYTNP